jgi:hypothetical protein
MFWNVIVMFSLAGSDAGAEADGLAAGWLLLASLVLALLEEPQAAKLIARKPDSTPAKILLLVFMVNPP